jgi:hypothetical protein
MERKIAYLRHDGLRTGTEKKGIDGPVVIISNALEIREQLDRIRACIEGAELLKLQPLDLASIDARLHEIEEKVFRSGVEEAPD